MRLPPRQSTAEADLMVPFQLVSLIWIITTYNRNWALLSLLQG